MVALGTPAPQFSLSDSVTGRTIALTEFADCSGLLIMFICNHCPFVIHVRDELASIADEYFDRGIGVVAINSNSVDTHPQDGPEHMRNLAEAKGWRFPYLFDETQAVAKSYGAACTPDLFLFDGDMKLYYRGQLDPSRPGNEMPVTGADLREALEGLLGGLEPPKEQRPSMGCNIKWAPGNEPDWYG
jgi:peroxiredoxin